MRDLDRGWWPLWSLVPFGWGTWIGFLVAGIRTGSRRWLGFGAFYLAIVFLAIPVSMLTAHGDDNTGLGLWILAWWGIGAAHSWAARRKYIDMISDPTTLDITRARARLRTRKKLLELAAKEPDVARELGVGRPDIAGAVDAGVVDVNNAPFSAIEKLPGVDREIAEHIVTTREELGGFSSLEDLGMTLDLDGRTVEDLRGRVVFLPR